MVEVADHPGFWSMARSSARLLLMIAAMSALAIFGASCVLPPDGQIATPTHYPPEIDLEELSPTLPFQVVPVNLPGPGPLECVFTARANRVIDRDSASIRSRWVADNLRMGLVNFIDGQVLTTGTAPLAIQQRIVPNNDFVPPVVDDIHSLSLFVTDASDWEVSDPDARNGTFNGTDLGRIKTIVNDAGEAADHVIEVRWVFKFKMMGTEGECPPS
jgi:hypothetical protein